MFFKSETTPKELFNKILFYLDTNLTDLFKQRSTSQYFRDGINAYISQPQFTVEIISRLGRKLSSQDDFNLLYNFITYYQSTIYYLALEEEYKNNTSSPLQTMCYAYIAKDSTTLSSDRLKEAASALQAQVDIDLITNLNLMAKFAECNGSTDPKKVKELCREIQNRLKIFHVNGNIKNNIIYMNLSNIQLENMELIPDSTDSVISLPGCNLSNANLSGANLTKAWLPKCNLTDANCTNTNLNRANLKGSKLIRTKIDGSKMSDTDLENAHVDSVNTNHLAFSDTDKISKIILLAFDTLLKSEKTSFAIHIINLIKNIHNDDNLTVRKNNYEQQRAMNIRAQKMPLIKAVQNNVIRIIKEIQQDDLIFSLELSNSISDYYVKFFESERSELQKKDTFSRNVDISYGHGRIIAFTDLNILKQEIEQQIANKQAFDKQAFLPVIY